MCRWGLPKIAPHNTGVGKETRRCGQRSEIGMESDSGLLVVRGHGDKSNNRKTPAHGTE